jgi:predicted PurR-regulated permease PerM
MTESSRLVAAVRILAGCAVIALLYFARPVLLPILVAVFLLYALDPIVDRLQRARVPRPVGAVGEVMLVIALATAGFLVLWPQIDKVVDGLPACARQLRETLREARSGTSAASALQKVQAAAQALDEAAATDVAESPATRRGTLRVELAEPGWV